MAHDLAVEASSRRRENNRRRPIIGITGAHHSGKSTLARRTSEVFGIYYHDASVSKIARELGYNAVADLPILERIKVQHHILRRFIEDILKAPRPAITDRTPLDMIAYMLGEVTMHNTDAETGDAIYAYVQECLAACERYFDLIILLRPLEGYSFDPKSPPPNKAYQWQTQFLIEGALAQLEADNTAIATLRMQDLDVRMDCFGQILQGRQESLTKESKTYTHN